MTLREWVDISADLWQMERDAKGHGKAGGAKELAAFAQVVNADGE